MKGSVIWVTPSEQKLRKLKAKPIDKHDLEMTN